MLLALIIWVIILLLEIDLG